MTDTFYFVSGNENKISEAQTILEIPIKIAKLELDEIQTLDIEKLVRHKAKSAFAILKKPLLVDDVGLYVQAWNGFPGPFIKFVDNGDGENELLLRMLNQEKNRNVAVKSAIGFHDGKKIHVFIGEVVGELTTEPRGTNGWGFDSVFQPLGSNKTFSEMTSEEKNKLSHRRNALEKVKSFFIVNNLFPN